MSANPLISIVVPAYNSAKYISRCLDNLLSQDYRNFEIVVVNDGSKDNTGSIIDKYASEYDCIKAVHQENQGVTAARLNGVCNSSGEYIGFVDSDDEIEPDMYVLLVENALKYSADISHCGYSMVFPSRVVDYYGTGVVIEQDDQKGIYDLLEGAKIEPGLVNKLFKKDLFRSLLNDNKIDKSIKINEDLLMNFYLFRESQKSVFEDVCKYHYMVREGSAATSSINKHKLSDPLQVRKIMLGECSGLPECQYVLRRSISYILISLATISINPNKDLILPYRKNARRELRKLLPEILREQSLSLKIKSLWASFLPTSYRLVHEIYMKITGLDKIYDVN